MVVSQAAPGTHHGLIARSSGTHTIVMSQVAPVPSVATSQAAPAHLWPVSQAAPVPFTVMSRVAPVPTVVMTQTAPPLLTVPSQAAPAPTIMISHTCYVDDSRFCTGPMFHTFCSRSPRPVDCAARVRSPVGSLCAMCKCWLPSIHLPCGLNTRENTPKM